MSRQTSRGKLGGCRHRFDLTAGKHVVEKAQDLPGEQTVGGQDLFAIETKRLAVEADHGTTRLQHQQRAGRRIPGVQIEFPIAVEASARCVCQIERGRSGSSHAMRAKRDLLIEVDIRILD